MHGEGSTRTEQAANEFTPLRKANECITGVKRFKPPEMLFDEFWREGELALMFGASGTGKSVLALQVAEAVARGTGIDGFKMTERRHKVLYADMTLSNTQFHMRYLAGGKRYKLSENLYRDSPPSNDKLCEWLREQISKYRVQAVVIDDLSAIRQTYDGTRDTVKLMRELRKITLELGVSILVLAGAREPVLGSLVSEADMQRSRVLCDAADSVFAIAPHQRSAPYRYLIQTRSRSAPIYWGRTRPTCGWITRRDDGFLGFEFDQRSVREIGQEERELICNIKWRHRVGASFRCISEELGISKTRAARLCKKWTPELEAKAIAGAAGAVSSSPPDNHPVCSASTPPLTGGEPGVASVSDGEAVGAAGDQIVEPESTYSPPTANWRSIPWLAALRRILITDLKRGFDDYGREIFIESENERGKPMIWYSFDRKAAATRHVRMPLGGTLNKRFEGRFVPR